MDIGKTRNKNMQEVDGETSSEETLDGHFVIKPTQNNDTEERIEPAYSTTDARQTLNIFIGHTVMPEYASYCMSV